MGLKLVGKQDAVVKLIPIEGPAVSGYTRGFIDGLGAVCQLGALIAYFCESYGGKEMSRLLSEAIGPLGRNLVGYYNESSLS